MNYFQKQLNSLLKLMQSIQGVSTNTFLTNERTGVLCLRINRIQSISIILFFTDAENIRRDVYLDSRPTTMDSNAQSISRICWSFSFSLDQNEDLQETGDRLQGFRRRVIRYLRWGFL